MKEQQFRNTLLDQARGLHERGFAWREIGQSLDVSERTLRHWRRNPQRSSQLRRRGRPGREASRQRRSEVFRFLQMTGPMIGLPILQALFKDLTRVTLQDLLLRYRRWWRSKNMVDGQRLTWLVPGTVWAMDFTEPKFKIDARYPYLFTVRDLASHCHLCWEPVRAETADEVIPILRRLFARHGEPLVMKSDNGSAFIAETTRDCFAESRVAVLYSPPRKPKYNGALERSNTTMKSWTAASAQANGHPMHWTSADLQQALQTANELSRPWGPNEPTPREAWQQRQPIDEEQRQRLLDEFVAERVAARKQLGFDKLDDEELSGADWRQINRVALSPVLQRLEYLKLTPVRRAPNKPGRPKPDRVQQAAARINASTPSPTAAEDQTPGNANPVTTSCPPPSSAETAPKKSLADASNVATMQPQQDAIKPRAAPPQATTPKHRARAFLTWLRRPITLLLSLFKAAKIS